MTKNRRVIRVLCEVFSSKHVLRDIDEKSSFSCFVDNHSYLEKGFFAHKLLLFITKKLISTKNRRFRGEQETAKACPQSSAHF